MQHSTSTWHPHQQCTWIMTAITLQCFLNCPSSKVYPRDCLWKQTSKMSVSKPSVAFVHASVSLSCSDMPSNTKEKKSKESAAEQEHKIKLLMFLSTFNTTTDYSKRARNNSLPGFRMAYTHNLIWLTYSVTRVKQWNQATFEDDWIC